MDDTVFRLHAELEDRHWWFEGRRQAVYPLAEQLLAENPGQVIDVGCGTGGTIAPLSRRYTTLGVDPSPLAIEVARRKYPETRFICGKMPEALLEERDATSLYLLMDVLEHVPDDRGFLADLVDLARPGAHILVTVPARPDLWSDHDVVAEHLRRYEADTLQAVWQGLDVQPRLLSYFNARLFPPIWLARQLGKLLTRTAGRDGTDFALPPAPINTLLASLFGGEGKRLSAALAGSAHPYTTGVSLIAVLRSGS
ncbi:hypothetical protein WV31_12900 [Magnetospirillum sp. ME-1]|uniref:class I SAM-dependent methyltransferase n=1 Tax=Magnetospirillum sp. ME-1 TaxID=1639348 RepID=UPI000A17AD70|nr:class I SAM-dependent methyltransferase [Magnetospirillum sp. ME-1]ARJ66502.1 hypothetical protein WV31_12900 [Magnetospirillum sp. ME-1]